MLVVILEAPSDYHDAISALAAFAALSDQAAGGDTRMYIHAKDGIYQVLCPACSDHYIAARPLPFKGTDFGRRLNLV